MTESEIDDMQKEMNKEAGMEPDEGGVEIGDDSDGVTRDGENGDQ